MISIFFLFSKIFENEHASYVSETALTQFSVSRWTIFVTSNSIGTDSADAAF